MGQVIYCGLYNDICNIDYCVMNHDACGAGASSAKKYVSKEEAEKLIAEGKAKVHQKEIQRAKKLLESEGYKINK